MRAPTTRAGTPSVTSLPRIRQLTPDTPTPSATRATRARTQRLGGSARFRRPPPMRSPHRPGKEVKSGVASGGAQRPIPLLLEGGHNFLGGHQPFPLLEGQGPAQLEAAPFVDPLPFLGRESILGDHGVHPLRLVFPQRFRDRV